MLVGSILEAGGATVATGATALTGRGDQQAVTPPTEPTQEVTDAEEAGQVREVRAEQGPLEGVVPRDLQQVPGQVEGEPQVGVPEEVTAPAEQAEPVTEEARAAAPPAFETTQQIGQQEATTQGVPPELVTDPLPQDSILPDPSKTAGTHQRAWEANQKGIDEWRKRQGKPLLSRLKRAWVDRAGNVKSALSKMNADTAVEKLVTLQGASGRAQAQFTEAKKQVLGGLNKTEQDSLAKLINARRTIEATALQAERGIELDSPISTAEAESYLSEEFEALPADSQQKVVAAAEAYGQVMNDQLTQLRDAGLISEEGFQTLSENHQFYSPRQFVEILDPVTQSPTGERTHDSGIKALDEGSSGAMVTDPNYLMAHVISRTQQRVARNEANQELLSVATDNPGNGVVRLMMPEGDKLARGESAVTAFVDGNERTMAMPSDLASEWNGQPPVLSADTAQWMQWMSGTKILKALATGVNPEFALSNLPRDAMFAWFNSGEYNSTLPIGLMQLGSDYARVTKDAFGRGQRFKDYVAEGGSLDFLTSQGIGGKKGITAKAGGPVKAVADVLSYLGETSEIATRLAVRERALRNGKTPEQATFAARNMLDFAQGGQLSKAADNIVPYLNAAIQGTRGTFREFATRPAAATYKASQLAGIGYSMAWVAASLFPDLWESISDREKATKWIIPLPWTERDKGGNERRAYIAIPKDQFQQAFAAVGQSMVDMQAGRPWSGQVVNSMLSLIPVEMASAAPPVYNAWQAYWGNYDTWRQEEVWRGYQDISPHNEYTSYTPQVARDIADAAAQAGIEVSPERMATATGKIIPNSNPIGTILASLYEMPIPEKDRDTIVENVRNTPGVRRLLRFSRSTNVSAKNEQDARRLEIDTTGKNNQTVRHEIGEAKRSRNDKRQANNVRIDTLVGSANVTPSKLRAEIRQITRDKDEASRLRRRALSKRPDLKSGGFMMRPF
jgi:hypothetical protein